MPVNSVQFGQEPWQYCNGLQISNDATAPDTIVNISAGETMDSTSVYQLVSAASIAVDVSTAGLNGLDTGTFAASTVYAIHLVADQVNGNAIGAMASLSRTAPLLPFGYSVFKLIGYIVSDGDADILLGDWTAGNSCYRQFMYDAPIATAVTAGAATTDTAVSLAAFVPAVSLTPVWIKFAMTGAAASRTLTLKTFGAVGDQYQATTQVTAVVLRDTALILSEANSGAQSIEYLWSAGGGDAVAINVAGYFWVV